MFTFNNSIIVEKLLQLIFPQFIFLKQLIRHNKLGPWRGPSSKSKDQNLPTPIHVIEGENQFLQFLL